MSDERPLTTLLLVRHGQARAHDGSYDQHTPLSELGRRQADAVARALAAGPRPAAVYASPWPRALETAQPLARALAIQPILDPRLAEFALASVTLDNALRRPDLVVWRPEHRAGPQGETLAAFAARVAAFCEEITLRHVGERVAAVTHSGTIDGVLRWSVGLPAASPWQHDFDISTASITELRIWPRGRAAGGAPRYAAIGRVGDTSHLGDLAADM